MSSHPPHRSALPSRFYRSIAMSFTVLVLMLAATTLVLALARAEVTVIPAQEEKEWTSTVTVIADTAASPSPETIPGRITTKTLTLEASSPVSDGTLVEDRAHGVITVINTYNSNQPLVATTRFLSSEGILFRSTKTIAVPAGNRVEVEVRADQPGKKGEIGPSHFTIPGLWTGLQDKIYGESRAPMTGGERRVTAITPPDIEKARAALAATATATLHELNATREKEEAVRALEKIKETILTPVHREADAARVSGTYTLTTVAYDAEALSALLGRQATLRFSNAQRFSLSPPALTLERVTGNHALLSVSQKAHSTPSSQDLRIDRQWLKGKRVNDAERILRSLPGVGEVTIALKPGFLKRLPRLSDHISITYTEP